MTTYKSTIIDGKLACANCEITTVEVTESVIRCSQCKQTLFGGHNLVSGHDDYDE